MSEITTRDLIEQAAPLAQELVRLSNERTKSLLVWLLALRMAEKIEVEIYLATAPANLADELVHDRANIEEVVSNMVVQPRGPSSSFNLSTKIIEPGNGQPS